jgi:hypothetical protein
MSLIIIDAKWRAVFQFIECPKRPRELVRNPRRTVKRWSPDWWCGVTLFFGLTCSHLPPLIAADAAKDRPGDDSSAQLVRQALLAEASGKTSKRAQLLQRAVEDKPDYAPAHWQLGEVRVGDRWLSIEAAAQEAARAGHVDKYRQLRARVRPSASDHLNLAHWCSQQKLPGQERLHLLFALQYAPKLHEAIEKLDLTRYHGELMPRSQAQAMDRRATESAAVVKTWKPRLVKMRRDIESNVTARQVAATRQLRSIDDPLLIPALEFLTTDSSAEIGEAVVASLSKMSDQAATDSLSRHAVFAEKETVRKAASEALHSRSIFSYVPTMIFALQTPTEVQFDNYYENGQFLHRLAMFQRGLFRDRSFVSTGGTSEDIIISHRYGNSDTILPDTTLAQDALLAEQVSQANEA